MAANHDELSLQKLYDRLNELETRISRIEKGAHTRSAETHDVEDELNLEPLKNLSEGIFSESRIGESGLAWLGNIVLFLGITFFEQYIDNAGHAIASSLFGYFSVAGIFILAYFLRKSYPRMTFIFNLNGYILLFYVTLRLHFFTAAPVISSKPFGLILLLVVAAVQIFLAIRRQSAVLAGIGLVFLAVIAVVGMHTHAMLPVALLLASMAVFFLYRYGWSALFQVSIVMVYLILLLWFINNPLMGGPMQAIQEHQFGYVYLFAIASVYSLATLIRDPEKITNSGIITSILFNGLGFSAILALIIITFFKDDYFPLIIAVSLISLLYAVLLQIKTERRIPPALYALYGFVTLSIAVQGIYGFPQAYFLLAIQSILVVTIAIWFRSKFIVGMNTMLFIILLAVYSATSELIDSVNVSFSLAALVTARILNWQKERLTIKTDILRNIYLLMGFIMVLITLYHAIPARYITLSWAVAALLYFLLSMVLKNVKYRYMALATLAAAAVYLFIVDLAKIELVYRVVALMFLAIISIGLSIFYSRRSRRKAAEE